MLVRLNYTRLIYIIIYTFNLFFFLYINTKYGTHKKRVKANSVSSCPLQEQKRSAFLSFHNLLPLYLTKLFCNFELNKTLKHHQRWKKISDDFRKNVSKFFYGRLLFVHIKVPPTCFYINIYKAFRIKITYSIFIIYK